ncbi:MAG: hypothetical protein ACYC7E_22995 [Armatimonadota bacterium]
MPSVWTLLTRMLWKALLPIAFAVVMLVFAIPYMKKGGMSNEAGIWFLISIAVGVSGLWKGLKITVGWIDDREATRGKPVEALPRWFLPWLRRLALKVLLPLALVVGSFFVFKWVTPPTSPHFLLGMGILCLVAGVGAFMGIWGLLRVACEWDSEEEIAQSQSVEARLTELPLETLRALMEREVVPSKRYEITTDGELSAELRAQLGPATADFFARYQMLTIPDAYPFIFSRDDLGLWEEDEELLLLTTSEEYDYVVRPREDGIFETQVPPAPDDTPTFPSVYHMVLQYYFGDSHARLHRALASLEQ